MPRFSRTLIVGCKTEDASALAGVLNEIGVARVLILETTQDAWLYLKAERIKSSIRTIFLSGRDVVLAGELLKQVMSDENLSHIHVVLVANLKPQELIMLYRYGAISSLTPPFEIEAVRNIVDRLPGIGKKAASE